MPGAGDTEPDAIEDDGGERVLVASLGAWWVAVAAEDVAGVVPPAPVAPVGGTPPWVVGLAAVRGAVVPVVDARRLAGGGAGGGAGDDVWWVLLAAGGLSAAVAGLRVWRVAPVAGGDGAGTEPPPAPPGLPARGVARLAGDGGRGASALPPAARRLDVAALLDLVHEPT